MGTVNAGLFTSTTDEWPTPQDLFDALDAEFGFTLDVCASADNAKCSRYYSRADDGLTQPWVGTVWMNPPYGRGIGLWVAKAYRASQAGATVVCLLPARTDTAYWHDYAMRASEIRLIRGRLHFTGTHHDQRVASGASVAHNAPFPSAIVVFRPGVHVTLLRPSERDGSAAVGVPEPTQEEREIEPLYRVDDHGVGYCRACLSVWPCRFGCVPTAEGGSTQQGWRPGDACVTCGSRNTKIDDDSVPVCLDCHASDADEGSGQRND